MKPIVVVEAKSYDVPHIISLMTILAEEEGENGALTEEYACQYLESKNSFVLLAQAGGEPIGLLAYSIRPDLFHGAPSCLIEALVVRPEARGQGVGSVLMNACLKAAREAKCAEVSVSTLQNNQAARAFYQQHGFEEGALFLEVHF